MSESLTREIEFSLYTRMDAIIKAFPSVNFRKLYTNGGVTICYSVSGPRQWVEKIERKYAY